MKKSSVAARLVTLFFTAFALVFVDGIQHVSAHLQERAHAHDIRAASLTIPTVSSSASSSSGSESGASASSAASPVTTTETVLTTSSGSEGTSTFTTTVTTLAIPGSANGSATATTTAFPSLSTYSTCVIQCFDLAAAAPNCSSVTDIACYCASSIFTSTLNDCVSSNCTDQLTSADNLAQQFCSLDTPSVSLSFPSSSASASASASGSSNSSSSASPTSTSAGSSTSSSAATDMRIGFVGLQSLAVGLLGIALGTLLMC